MVSINTNTSQMQAIAQLTRMSALMGRSMERLATGYKINRASDDPAGMIVAEGMKAEEKAIQAQLEALDREEYRVGAREGAASVVSDMLGDLNALVVGAANTGGTSVEEREAMQLEADSILQAINHISNTTTFNGERVINGYTADAMGRVSEENPGPDGTRTSYSLADLAAGGRLNLVDGDIEMAQESVSNAITSMATERGAMGAYLKGKDAQRESLLTQLEEVTKAKSQIIDTDYAKETAELVRAKALQQVSIFLANLADEQNANTVLSLVSGVAKPA